MIEVQQAESAPRLILEYSRTQTGDVLTLSTACRLTERILRGPTAPDSALVNLHSLSECRTEILVGVRRFERPAPAYPVRFSFKVHGE